MTHLPWNNTVLAYKPMHQWRPSQGFLCVTFAACLLGHEATHQVKMPVFSPYKRGVRKKGLRLAGACIGVDARSDGYIKEGEGVTASVLVLSCCSDEESGECLLTVFTVTYRLLCSDLGDETKLVYICLLKSWFCFQSRWYCVVFFYVFNGEPLLNCP